MRSWTASASASLSWGASRGSRTNRSQPPSAHGRAAGIDELNAGEFKALAASAEKKLRETRATEPPTAA